MLVDVSKSPHSPTRFRDSQTITITAQISVAIVLPAREREERERERDQIDRCDSREYNAHRIMAKRPKEIPIKIAENMASVAILEARDRPSDTGGDVVNKLTPNTMPSTNT
ncbi:hypothetical protein M8J76_002456 [Diaphorina citri]|nr:hypothetical protein M8J76_002456 [Diaphorina citri]